MAIGDDSVKSDLVQIGSFKLQHFVYAVAIDAVSGLPYLFRSSVGTPKPGLDQLFAVLVQKVERVEVSARRDLD
jgi:hypothetical protein